MSRGLNKAQILGYLGQDPETRFTQSNTTITNLRIATSEQWKDKQTGEQREKTEWHSVVLFGRIAEVAAEYLQKGARVYVEGKLQTRKWQDREGNDRWSTEIVGSELIMLGDSKPAPMPGRSEPDPPRSRDSQQQPELSDEIPFAFALVPFAGLLAAIASSVPSGA